MDLMDHQREALKFLDNGKILYGGVGVGKTAVALAYYMEKEAPRTLYVITTAKKRDSLDWQHEAVRLGISETHNLSRAGMLTVDSWNNIDHYLEVEGAFFIFDEQRVVGHGAWVRHFLKLTTRNRWILLSATPGDTWMDYAPVFIANGWYKNITDFKRQHVVYAPYVKFPKILRYLGESKLERLRNEILVEMPYVKHTQRILNYMPVGYDTEMFNWIVKNRWHIYEDRPLRDAGDLWRLLRKIVNSDESRIEMIEFLATIHPKLIVFYNFDYELDILRGLCLANVLREWNGHRKDPIPDTDSWIYLVQYSAGGEGWNCVETDAMVLYSLTYSYKNFIQSQGRIDRLNSAFIKLYYYILVSESRTDAAVRTALDNKKSFNEREELKKWSFPSDNSPNASSSNGYLHVL